jgi:hypothetical protein
VESTWYSRDLPVLETAILFIEENGHDPTPPNAQEIAEAEGRTLEEVLLALRALDGAYLELDEITDDPVRRRCVGYSRRPGRRSDSGQPPSS